jgi:predicted AAA+ superfamily ATPase
MKDILKQFIYDFQSNPLPKGVERVIEVTILPPPIRKAQVFMGMRRTGKTWLLYQHMRNLLAKGIAKEKIFYINFEDDRLTSFKVENFQQLLEAYFDLHPEYLEASDLHFCFDEIQIVPGWEKFIRRLLDKEKMQVYITGSSAKMLSKELATSLRGRCLTKEVFPLSFFEFASYKLKKLPNHFTTKEQSQFRHLSRIYLKSGGFPETLFLDENLHREVLQDYVNAAVFRDVIERHKIQSVPVVKRFLTYCLQNVAAPLSISKVYQVFKSQGESVGKNSL